MLNIFQILYYKNIGFSDVKFFKLILQTIILNISYLLRNFENFFQILYYRSIGLSDGKFFKLILKTIILNIIYF